jgi:hypothetical protein
VAVRIITVVFRALRDGHQHIRRHSMVPLGLSPGLCALCRRTYFRHDGTVKEKAHPVEEWVPEFLVRRYRGDHLIEHQFSDSPETVGGMIESWEASSGQPGAVIVAEPHPPEAIVTLLRAIADAIEQERPVAMPRPFPRIRLQLVTEGVEPDRAGAGELRLLWHELAHPGG